MTNPVRIGSLHWPITISKRIDTPDPTGAGMLETLVDPIESVADIQPAGPVTYFGSINADFERPVTHKIYVRWTTPISSLDPSVDLTYQISRTLNTPDGRSRTETFRVWRWLEIEGKQRHIEFSCQLEKIISV